MNHTYKETRTVVLIHLVLIHHYIDVDDAGCNNQPDNLLLLGSPQ